MHALAQGFGFTGPSGTKPAAQRKGPVCALNLEPHGPPTGPCSLKEMQRINAPLHIDGPSKEKRSLPATLPEQRINALHIDRLSKEACSDSVNHKRKV